MFVQRYYLDCLSHASYMVADESSQIAAVIDPQRDIDIYLEDAKQHGFTIQYVLLTHFHADFISGHIELRDRIDARIVMGSKAEPKFDILPLGNGESVDLGGARLQALHTPGHTPEAMSILLFESADAAQPTTVFTGDALFIGDVGRPDLLASVGVTAEELAGMLYDSLHEKLLALPDETIVYPAHGAGSMCGRSLGTEPSSTIGEQRKYNYALQPMSREEFITMIVGDQPEAPAYFAHDASLNKEERQSLDESLAESLKALSLDDVLALQTDGAQIVDVRDAADFAGSHLRGAINIGIDGKYATWCGTILKKDAPIVVIADSERFEEAIMRLGRIGFDTVRGYLDGGMTAFADRPDLTESTTRITAPTVRELDGDVTIIDIRAAKEFEGGHIADAVNIPLNHLEDRLSEVPESGHVVVHCAGGYRSSIAASLLQRAGRTNTLDLIGGYKAWVTSKLPVV